LLYTFLTTEMLACVYYQVCVLVQLVGSRYKSYKHNILIKIRLNVNWIISALYSV